MVRQIGLMKILLISNYLVFVKDGSLKNRTSNYVMLLCMSSIGLHFLGGSWFMKYLKIIGVSRKWNLITKILFLIYFSFILGNSQCISILCSNPICLVIFCYDVKFTVEDVVYYTYLWDMSYWYDKCFQIH